MEYLFSLHLSLLFPSMVYTVFTITSFYDAYMIRLSVTFPVKENYIAGGRLIAPLLPLTFSSKPVDTIAYKRKLRQGSALNITSLICTHKLGELVAGGHVLPTVDAEAVAAAILPSAAQALTYDGVMYGYLVRSAIFMLHSASDARLCSPQRDRKSVV